MTFFQKIDMLSVMIRKFEETLPITVPVFRWGDYSIVKYGDGYRVCYNASSYTKPVNDCSLGDKIRFAKVFREFRNAHSVWAEEQAKILGVEDLDKCLKDNEDLL